MKAVLRLVWLSIRLYLCYACLFSCETHSKKTHTTFSSSNNYLSTNKKYHYSFLSSFPTLNSKKRSKLRIPKSFELLLYDQIISSAAEKTRSETEFHREINLWRSQLYPYDINNAINVVEIHKDIVPREDPLSAKWLPVPCKIAGFHLKKTRTLFGESDSNVILEMKDRTSDRKLAYKLFKGTNDFAMETNFYIFSFHPNIVRPICIDRDKGSSQRAGIVFEFIDGPNALQYAKLESTTIDDLKRVAGELLSALIHVHWLGFVHADLKPENVMITSSGETKLIDFGFALPLPFFQKNRGNPTILAPELAELVDGPIEEAIDMWAYASTLAALFGFKYLPEYGGVPANDTNSFSRGRAINSHSQKKLAKRLLKKKAKQRRQNKKANTMDPRYVIARISKDGSKYRLGRVPIEFPKDLRQVLFILTNPDPTLRNFNTPKAIDQLLSLPFFKGVSVPLPW